MSRTRVLIATILVAMTTACLAVGPRTDGPLSLGQGSGAVCMLPGPTSDYTYGMETLRNNGHRAVKITRVTLVSARAITMPEAYVLPIAGHNLIGNVLSWPPNTAESDAVWHRKVVAAGATVLPSRETTDNLVVHLHTDGPSSGFDAIQVEYMVDGTRYVGRTTTAVSVTAAC